MRITATKTLTGMWLELVEPITAEDFVIEDRKAVAEDPSEYRYSKRVGAIILMTLKQDVADNIQEMVKSLCDSNDNIWGTMDRVLETLFNRTRDDWKVTTEGIHSTADFKMTKATPHEKAVMRIQKAVDEANKLFDRRDTEIAEFVKRMNDSIQRHIDDKNESTMERVERALREQDPDSNWTEIADEGRSEETTPIKDELSSIADQIAALKEKQRELNENLQAIRNESFLNTLEKEGWVFSDQKMPEPVIAEFKRVLNEGKGFKVGSRDLIFG